MGQGSWMLRRVALTLRKMSRALVCGWLSEEREAAGRRPLQKGSREGGSGSCRVAAGSAPKPGPGGSGKRAQQKDANERTKQRSSRPLCKQDEQGGPTCSSTPLSASLMKAP